MWYSLSYHNPVIKEAYHKFKNSQYGEDVELHT
jgi:hypothetical protein